MFGDEAFLHDRNWHIISIALEVNHKNVRRETKRCEYIFSVLDKTQIQNKRYLIHWVILFSGRYVFTIKNLFIKLNDNS